MMTLTLATLLPLLARLGLTLVHFLWQGALLAFVAAGVLIMLRKHGPQARYWVCGGTLALFVAAPPVTFGLLDAPVGAATSVTPILAPPADVTPVALPPELGVVHETPAAGAPASTRLVRTSNVAVAAPDAGAMPTAPAVHGTFGAVDLLPWVAAAWCAGVLLLALRLMAGWVGTRQLRRETVELPSGAAVSARRIAERLGVRGVSIRSSMRIVQPMVVGLWRPMVLLPAALLTQCPVEVVEAMIAHELVHIRRYDMWVNLLQRMAEVLLFFHPATWWLSGRMRAERELCCDDEAVNCTGQRAAYAEALVLAGRACQQANPLVAAMFERRAPLTLRVRRVLQVLPNPVQRRYWLAGPLSVLCVTGLLLAGQLQPRATAGQEQPTTTTPTEPNVPAVGPELRAAEIPETIVIDSSFDEARANYAQTREEVEQQRALLAPVMHVVQAWGEFGAAARTADRGGLAQRFQPNDAATLDQLLADLNALKLQSEASSAWELTRCWVDPDGHGAFLVSAPFDVPAGQMSLEMRLLATLQRGKFIAGRAPDGERWIVTGLALVKHQDLIEQVAARLTAITAPAGARGVNVLFQAGRPWRYQVWARVQNARTGVGTWQQTIPELPPRGVGDASFGDYRSMATSEAFDPPLSEWQAFEVPKHPREMRGGRFGSGSYSSLDVGGEPFERNETATPIQTQNVFALIDGVVTQVLVKDGAKVAKGDVLVKLDDAETELAVEAAVIRVQQARAAVERNRIAVERGIASQEVLAASEADSRLAEIEYQRQALRLARMTIRAPEAGHVQSVRVAVGERVEPGTPVVTAVFVSIPTTQSAQP